MSLHRRVYSTGAGVLLQSAVLAVSGVLLAANSRAQNITMQDEGSTAVLNPGNGTGDLGMNYWGVDTVNQNQLNQQWFWYSVNGSAAAPINNLGGMSITDSGDSPNNGYVATVAYGNSQLSVSVTYSLLGNGTGSGGADLSENITIQNVSANPLSLSFYQYSYFNLLQNNNNSVTIGQDPHSGLYTSAQQTATMAGGNGIAEIIASPDANRAEAAYLGQTLGASELGGGTYYQLNDTTSAGPGQVTWAFEWDTPTGTPLAPGASLSITKDKGLSISVVPEPSTFALIALGAGALGLMLRRKSA